MDEESLIHPMFDCDGSERSDCGVEEPDFENNEIPTLNERVEFRTMMRQELEIYDEQEACGNMKFVEKFLSANSNRAILVEEIQRFKYGCNIPQT